MMLHQDGSTHQWVSGRQWDLIVTMDDATNEHYSMFFVVEEGTASSFRGVREVIEQRGLFSSLYTDRGSHYWQPPRSAARWTRATSLTDKEAANRYLWEVYRPAYNAEFKQPAAEEGSAFVPFIGQELTDILCEQFILYLIKARLLPVRFERTVGKDNCVSFEDTKLQIPADRHRMPPCRSFTITITNLQI
ncbi:MAG: hypothetical protein ACREXW_03675 [Gammaproteobacteria bacterium]